MKTKTANILMVLRILAWLGVLGYAVNLGSQLISVGVSFFNPIAAKKLPGISQNLMPLIELNRNYYIGIMTLVITISAMYLKLWYVIVTLLSKLNIQTPFTKEVSKLLEEIAYWFLAIWIISFIGDNYTDWLSKRLGEDLSVISVSSQLLFSAGIVYVISQIFKHGIEMQEENQQTV